MIFDCTEPRKHRPSLQNEWVRTELRKACKAERQSGQRKLFRVLLVDIATLRDWESSMPTAARTARPFTCRRSSPYAAASAVQLREHFIPDFSHWKEHDPFETAFARLLKDLRSEEGAN